MTKTLLLIDGNNLFHRAYHALPPLTTKSGQMANAVFGFSNMLIKAINEVEPAYIACAFDTAAPTFRHIEFEKYKAQRAAPPPDLYPQLPLAKKVLDSFGIKYFEKEGYEADDLLATLATQVLRLKTKVKVQKQKALDVSRSSLSVIILSGDRDVLQLVNGNVKVQAPGWNLKETTLYNPKTVVAKYGLEPHQMVDYKSLTGDPSDNVPGISGIGPKTASQLLQKYHTLENLLKHIGDQPESIRTKLEAGKEAALSAKELIELDREVDISCQLPELSFNPDWEKVRQIFDDLGFKSIAAKLPGSVQEVSKEKSQSRAEKTNNQSQLELI